MKERMAQREPRSPHELKESHAATVVTEDDQMQVSDVYQFFDAGFAPDDCSRRVTQRGYNIPPGACISELEAPAAVQQSGENVQYSSNALLERFEGGKYIKYG